MRAWPIALSCLLGTSMTGACHPSTGASSDAGEDARGLTSPASGGSAAEDAAVFLLQRDPAKMAASGPAPFVSEMPTPTDLTLKAGFRKTKIDAPALAAIFSTIPELVRIGPDVRLFDPADAKNVLARSGAPSDGITLSMSPLLWNPEPGVELLVATGRGKSMSFVVALYPLPDDKYRLASYFLLLNDLAPLALAYDAHRRKELMWSACWGCAGEQGYVSIRDDHRVFIVQR